MKDHTVEELERADTIIEMQKDMLTTILNNMKDTHDNPNAISMITAAFVMAINKIDEALGFERTGVFKQIVAETLLEEKRKVHGTLQ